MVTDASPDPARAEAAIADQALAEAVHGHNGFATAEDLTAYRREYYERGRKAKRADRQLLFLFFLVVVAFVVLALKVQQNNEGLRDNDSKLATGLYVACLQRTNAAHASNISREGLVQLAINGPNAPRDAAAKAALANQLRNALKVPEEDCGPRPN